MVTTDYCYLTEGTLLISLQARVENLLSFNRIEATTSDLCSQPGAYDYTATQQPHVNLTKGLLSKSSYIQTNNQTPFFEISLILQSNF